MAASLATWEASKEAEHYRALDEIDVIEAAIDGRIAEVTQDIELNHGTVAKDVCGWISGDDLDDTLPIIARLLLDKQERDYTPIERLMRKLLNIAIVNYAGAKIAAEAKQGEECQS